MPKKLKEPKARDPDLFYGKGKDDGSKTNLQKETYKKDIEIVKSANLSKLIKKIEKQPKPKPNNGSKTSFSNNIGGGFNIRDQQHIIGL